MNHIHFIKRFAHKDNNNKNTGEKQQELARKVTEKKQKKQLKT